MAQRRMFSKSITNSSEFITMPHSSQALYFQLGMNADDDGFCEHIMVMRIGSFQPDDLKILAAKKFIQMLNNGVLVILHWQENNYIQKDRYHKSRYIDMYTACIQNVNKMDPQVRLGKDRLDKDNIYSCVTTMFPKEISSKKHIKDKEKTANIQTIIDDLNAVLETNYKPVGKNAELISARLKEGFTVDDFKKVHQNMKLAWGNDDKMQQFLRPITLYSNKFDGYLNRKLTEKEQEEDLSDVPENLRKYLRKKE